LFYYFAFTQIKKQSIQGDFSMKKKSIALLCAITLVFTGCSSGSSKQPASTSASGNTDVAKPSSNSSKDTTTKSDSSTETTKQAEDTSIEVSYKQDSKTYKSDDNSKDIFYMNYSNVAVTIKGNKKATKKINDFFATEKKSFDDSITSSIADAKSSLAEYPDGFSAFSTSQTYETQRCDKQVISFKSCVNSYTGGAHGNYGFVGYNFDVKTGKKLALDDIATNKNDLLNSARTYINSQLKLPIYSNALMSSLEESQDIINRYVLTDDTWYFTKSGLTFVSDPYVLGNYDAGALFLTVPYQQLEGLKADYQYTGNFVMSGPVGSTMSADLNGDESMDAIYYDASSDDSTGAMSSTLTINGKDFTSVLENDDRHLSPGASSNNGQQYFLIDLDTSDDYIELAIQDNGESNDCKTYFFRYNGKELNFLGCIYDELSFSSTNVPGDGTITANLPIQLLQTISGKATYKLDDDGFSLVPQDWYDINYANIEDKYQNHNILKDVTVYTEPDTNSDKVTLTSADGPVSFPAADNNHWYKIKTANGKLYYLYLDQFSTLESGEEANTIFENLYQVD
jgi:hypothetical protein